MSNPPRADPCTAGPASSTRRASSCALFGIGTSLPPYEADQHATWRFQQRVLSASYEPGLQLEESLRLLERFHQNSGIARRFTTVGDFAARAPEQFDFFPANWQLEPFPTTARRMERYERDAVPLAARAAQQALAQSGFSPGQVTHLILSSCTGFFAPGPDVLLARRLGLRPSVSRTVLGFMGCNAGLSGLRSAQQILRGDAPAVVLQVAVELCSLHFQKSLTPDTLLANSLFSDGCSAALYAHPRNAASAGRTPLALVLGTSSFCHFDSLDQMSWRVGETGFVMRLSAQVPATLRSELGEFVTALVEQAPGFCAREACWAIHPGGRKILEAVAQALELAPGQLDSSFEVLRDYGNMSSATILFVVQRELARTQGTTPLVALAFGPGLTIEGALLATPE